jgi:hypothetical protein
MITMRSLGICFRGFASKALIKIGTRIASGFAVLVLRFSSFSAHFNDAVHRLLISTSNLVLPVFISVGLHIS